MVGSIIPSSRVLIEKMLGPVDWPTTKLFVEYGPGVGTFTRPILNLLGPDATLVTVDTNPDFTRYLRNRSTTRGCSRLRDPPPTLKKFLPTATSARPITCSRGCRFDASAGCRRRHRGRDRQRVRPGGAFLVYQFSPKVQEFIKPHFEPIKRGFEWINVPPAVLFWAYKGEPAA